MAASVEFSYRLTRGEILRAMKKSAYYKTTGTRLIVESVILGALAIYFLSSYFTAGHNLFNIGMAAVALVFLVAIFVVPNADMNAKAKKVEQDGNLSVRVTPQKLVFHDGTDQWIIPLDKTAKCKVIDEKLIAVTTAKKQLVVIPIDKIPRNRSAEVQALIYEGTIAD